MLPKKATCNVIPRRINKESIYGIWETSGNKTFFMKKKTYLYTPLETRYILLAIFFLFFFGWEWTCFVMFC